MSTQKLINAKTLRSKLGNILKRASRGERFAIVYRSRQLCQIGPIESDGQHLSALEADSLYLAKAVGRSRDGKIAGDHDEILYGAARR